MNFYHPLTEQLSAALQSLYALSVPAPEISLQNTRPEFEGHVTFVVFPYLKASRKSPEATAGEIGAYLTTQAAHIVSSTQVVKGFLNITLSAQFWQNTLASICRSTHFGRRAAAPNAPLVMVEYSSPNTNKPLHLGHIRNNLLGYSLAQILQANGNKVVKTNIVNDRGIHICKSMLAWLKWGEGVTPVSSGKKGDHLVGDFYVLFDKHFKTQVAELQQTGLSKEEAEAQSPLMQEARAMLRKWEQGDADVVSLWKQMNEWVYAGFDETYKRLGVDFDKIYYESQTYLEGKAEVLEGLKKGLFEQHPDGSVWADLTQEGLDKKILLRSDGTSVYMTQDIGTAKTRYKEYPIDKMVYVVGNEQEYHFKVLSLLLDRLGFKFGKELTHFSYGMVELPEGKMKSREGTVVDADDLIDEMAQTAYNIATEARALKGVPAPAEEEARTTAELVGLGALKYFILKVDPRKNMTFNPKESIDFNGNTGAFIQYAYARICSLLDKAGVKEEELLHQSALSALPSAKECVLVQRLTEYPTAVQEAGAAFSPARIANYTYDLVKEFNQFYHDTPILKEENGEARTLRLTLCAMVGRVIADGMDLLGIRMPRRM